MHHHSDLLKTLNDGKPRHLVAKGHFDAAGS